MTNVFIAPLPVDQFIEKEKTIVIKRVGFSSGEYLPQIHRPNPSVSFLTQSKAPEDTFTRRIVQTLHFEGGDSSTQETKPKKNQFRRDSTDKKQWKLSQAKVSIFPPLHSAQNEAHKISTDSTTATGFNSVQDRSHHNDQGKNGSAAQRSLQKMLTRPIRSKTEAINNRASNNVRQQDNLNNVSSSSSPVSSSSCSTSSNSSSSCLSDVYELFGDKNETDKRIQKK